MELLRKEIRNYQIGRIDRGGIARLVFSRQEFHQLENREEEEEEMENGNAKSKPRTKRYVHCLNL